MPDLIRITDRDDPAISDYRDIRERDLAGRRKLFVAEGRVVLKVLLERSRFGVHSLFLLENRVAGLADLLAKVPPGIPVYVATRDVMDAIAGFPIHRGVLALGYRRTDDPDRTSLPDGPVLVMGLVGIANHDNMGGLFRNAAAFGVDTVLMDETCCDPLYRKAIRVSVGASLKVPFREVGSGEAMLDELAEADFAVYALTPQATLTLDQAPRAGRVALLFGAEGEGLPEEVLQRAEGLRISMAHDFDSLNVASSAAVALHHFRRLAA